MAVLTRGERFKGARLDYNKHGKQTMDEVATATGVSKSLIQALEDDENNRSVGYDKVAKLASYYGVSPNWLLRLSEDPHILPTAADDLDLSASAIELMRNFHHYTSIGKDGIEGLNLLIEKGFFLELAWRVKMFCNHVAEDIELSNKYEVDFQATSSDPKLQRINDDLNIADDIDQLILAQHPEYKGRFRVFTGYRFVAAEKRELVDDFEKMIRNISGYDRFLAGLHNDGTWL